MAPITGPKVPFRVYVLVKILKKIIQIRSPKRTLNLVTGALTDMTYVLRAIYQQGIT